VDYLKIDLNDWVNCTREGHGHGSRDGHFAHVKALYRLLAALRDEFPSLLIENCSGGGNRIDLGLARLTDAGWMDDRTTPSAHVRQNIQGLTAMLPPSYLLSYAMPSGAEFMSAAGDLPLLARSRMGGVLGMSYRDDELADADYTVLEREVEIYKRIRSLVPGRTAVLLTPQVTTDGPRPAWDTLEEASPDGTAAVVFACQNDGESGSTHVVPQRLAPEAMFEVVSIEGDRLAAGTGRALMAEGFILPASPSTTARVVLLVPAGTSSPVKSH
jgi:alpha-galactosidase